MELALLPGRGLIGLCVSVFFLLACGQMVHLVITRRSREGKFKRMTMVYEAAISLHLIISAFYANALGHAWFPGFAPIGPIQVPLVALLWLNVAIFACGLVLCIGARRPSLVLELVALLAMTPPVLDLVGLSFMIPVILDMVVFGFSVPLRLVSDYERSYSNVMPSAVASAMKAMPEGVLLATPNGKILFVNDVMRSLLAQLGVRADLSGLSDVLRAMQGEEDASAGERSMRVSTQATVVDSWQIWHVTVDETTIGRRYCVRILAIDITEESMLERELELANAQLESTEAQLVETLEEVREAAADEALIRMRSRVHDVIGQRLSLLHRYLEDESIDDERLDKMKPMLKGIVSDLREDADVDWHIELDSIVSAFSLVGVDVQVNGELPEDVDVAIACTGIIREAVTNAVKHANASEVHVTFSHDGGGLRMVIEDNGMPMSNMPMAEGQGIRGMRTVVARCGGALEIERDPSFTITATFPTM